MQGVWATRRGSAISFICCVFSISRKNGVKRGCSCGVEYSCVWKETERSWREKSIHKARRLLIREERSSEKVSKLELGLRSRWSWSCGAVIWSSTGKGAKPACDWLRRASSRFAKNLSCCLTLTTSQSAVSHLIMRLLRKPIFALESVSFEAGRTMLNRPFVCNTCRSHLRATTSSPRPRCATFTTSTPRKVFLYKRQKNESEADSLETTSYADDALSDPEVPSYTPASDDLEGRLEWIGSKKWIEAKEQANAAPLPKQL